MDSHLYHDEATIVPNATGIVLVNLAFVREYIHYCDHGHGSRKEKFRPRYFFSVNYTSLRLMCLALLQYLNWMVNPTKCAADCV
jgi:hypothetical protein